MRHRSRVPALLVLACLVGGSLPAGAGAVTSAEVAEPLIVYSITPPNGNNEIYTIRPDGSVRQQLTARPGRDAGPVWSPGGDQIAFYAHWPDESSWSIYVMNADGSGIQQLTNVWGVWDHGVTWSPDGSRIAFGREYPHEGYRGEVWVMNADGSDPHQIASTEGSGPDWSPDGARIAFHTDRDGNSEIYVMDFDGSNPERLTYTSAPEYWPDLSPDGSRIAFRSDRDGNPEIYVMNADGSDPIRLTNHPAEDSDPNWSPGGSGLAFSTFRDGHYEIYLMDADGANQRRLTTSSVHAIQPDWGPDSLVTIGVDSVEPAGPQKIGALPNPVQTSTRLSYSLKTGSRVRISVLDISGRRVVLLRNEWLSPGTQSVTWDGRDGTGRRVPPGAYFVQFESGGLVESRKIVVVR